jgi:nicotinamidase-related amidase
MKTRMTVVDFRPRPGGISLIVFADLQREYIAPGRRHSIAGVERCLAGCRRLLDAARALRIPVAHARQLRNDAFFNPHSEFSDWIPDFRPRPGEMVFEREQPSLYSNAEFAAFVEHIRHPVLVLAGLSASQACLSTAVGAHHRRHRLIFLGDCSASAPLGSLSEAEAHEAVCAVMAQYAEIATLSAFLGQISRPRALGVSA